MLWTSFLGAALLGVAAATPTPPIRRSPVAAKRSDVKFTSRGFEYDFAHLPRHAAKNAKRSSDVKYAVKDIKATTGSATLATTDNILTLKSAGTKTSSSKALRNAVRAKSANTNLLPAEQDAGYAIDIDFGGTTFEVIFDTGSSDLWLAETGVKCVNANMGSEPLADCGFGPLAKDTFQDGSIADENFNITYGDGEFLTGTLGYENVAVAGIAVDKQEVALVDYAYWVGDNITSGLMGFAYPTLTSAFTGTNPAADDVNTTLVPYTNWVFNAIDQGLIDPYFSLAIERGSNGGGGQLALGGLPTISFNQTFTTAPLEIIQLIPQDDTASNYSFYTITPDGFFLSGEAETYYGYESVSGSPSNNQPVIIDSGTTLAYLPVRIAEEVNALFDPPSVYIEEEGVYENYCDATAPTFAVRIGGTDFYINSADLLITGEEGEDPNTGGCLIGVQPMESAPYILGDTFLKNVVAVYDIGASEMKFAPHENY